MRAAANEVCLEGSIVRLNVVVASFTVPDDVTPTSLTDAITSSARSGDAANSIPIRKQPMKEIRLVFAVGVS